MDRIFTEAKTGFVISNLTITEFASTFVRKVKEGIIQEEDLSHALSEFSKDLITDFWVIDLDRTHIVQSVRLIIKHKTKTLDSLQLAILLSVRHSNPTLISSDKALLMAADSEGVPTINPENP